MLVFTIKSFCHRTKRFQKEPQLTWLLLYRYCWAGAGGCVQRNCPRYVRSECRTWLTAWFCPFTWFPWWLAAGVVWRTTSATGWTVLLCSSRLRSLLRTRRIAIMVPLLPTIVSIIQVIQLITQSLGFCHQQFFSTLDLDHRSLERKKIKIFFRDTRDRLECLAWF